MPYLLLIMEQREDRLNRSEAEGRVLYDRMLRFAASLEKRGVLKASQSLKPDSGAVRITARGGKRTVVDGPFAEAKEMVGGFFFVDCPTKEEAIALASECPAVEWATVEVREVGACWERA